MTLIDADTVVTIQVYDDVTGKTDTKKMTIADAIDEWSDEGCPPTIEAVEVVRCKDCRWRSKLGCAVMIVDESDRPKDDDFCSWGEKRENETN